METTDEAPRKNRWLWVWLGALVLLIAAVFFARPSYRQWKERRFQGKAREFLAKTNYRAAWFAGRQALVLNGTNLETLRLMAEIAAVANQPDAVGLRRKVAELEPGNPTNRLLWAQTALAFEGPPFAETRKALSGVPETMRQTLEYHFVSAALDLKSGNIQQAEAHFVAALELAPTNRQARINLAVLRLRSADEARRSEAQRTLEQYRTDPESRLAVLRSLAAYCRESGQREKALDYSRELLSDKEAGLPDELAYLEVLRGGGLPDQENFEAQLRQTQKHASTNALEVAQVVSWMQANESTDAALAWVAALPREMQEKLPVPMAVADLYAAAKKWREMEAYLRDQQWAEQDYARHALTAFALRNAGDLESSKLRWNRALRAAGQDLSLLVPLVRMAEEWGWRPEAEEALQQVTATRPNETWAWQELAKIYLSNGQTAELKDVFATMARNDTNDLIALNNLAVTRLLLNEEVSLAHQLAKEVYDRANTNASFTATYAYSLHRQGRSREALALFDQLTARQLADSSTAVYYGLVLAALGERDRAIPALERAAQASLLPEERQLAEEALKRIGAR